MNYLRVKNFKRISDEIAMKDLKNINYLVGKNSSGKSSILDAISCLNGNSGPINFFESDSIVEINIGEKIKKIVWEEKFETKPQSNGVLQIRTSIVTYSNDIEKGSGDPNLIRNSFDELGGVIENKEEFDSLNNTLNELGFDKIEVERKVGDAWEKDIGKKVFSQGSKKIDPSVLAQGIKTVYSLKKAISSGFSKTVSPWLENGERDVLLIVIEEPETFLHPALQKKVPEIIEKLLSEWPPEIREKIFLFIATHSPFIVSSASKYHNSKVYILEEGKLLSVADSDPSFGYEVEHCLPVVAQLLGADVTDLGYPENYCIIEESSLQNILDGAKEMLKNIQFVSLGGWSHEKRYGEIIKNLEATNTLIKCNPWYGERYRLILDKPDITKLQKGEEARFRKISEKLEDRYVELKYHNIEEYYKNIDQTIYDAFLAGSKTQEEKTKYSLQIAEIIKTPEDFSKLFEGELDFLLKEEDTLLR